MILIINNNVINAIFFESNEMNNCLLPKIIIILLQIILKYFDNKLIYNSFIFIVVLSSKETRFPFLFNKESVHKFNKILKVLNIKGKQN